MFLLELLCHPAISDQTIIIKELLADFDVAQGFKKNTHAILLGFQIGFAGVIDPLGGIAILLGINDVTVVQVEIEGVVWLSEIVGVESLSPPPGDDLALILQHSVAGFDGTDGVNTLAVNTRFTHLRAAAAGFRACHLNRSFEFILVVRQVIIISLYGTGVYINNELTGQEISKVAFGLFNIVILTS